MSSAVMVANRKDQRMPEITPANKIAPLTEVVTLPARPDGSAITMRVRALNGAGMLAAQEAATIMVPGHEPTNGQLADLERAFRRVAEAGIVEPKLAFGGDSSPQWDDLTVAEQTAIIEVIYRLSGVGQGKDRGTAQAAARFPDEP